LKSNIYYTIILGKIQLFFSITTLVVHFFLKFSTQKYNQWISTTPKSLLLGLFIAHGSQGAFDTGKRMLKIFFEIFFILLPGHRVYSYNLFHHVQILEVTGEQNW
jgi:hypothetical protein